MEALCRTYSGNRKGNGLEINPVAFYEYMKLIIQNTGRPTLIAIEKPFTNPRNVMTMVSARGTYASIQAVLELMKLPYVTVGAQDWQKKFIGSGPVMATSAKEKESKAKSRIMGTQRWPSQSENIKKQKDADALYLALYAKTMES